MQLNTINVVDIVDSLAGNVSQLVAFPATDEGKLEARECFRKIVRGYDNSIEDGEIDDLFEDGKYDDDNGSIVYVINSDIE